MVEPESAQQNGPVLKPVLITLAVAALTITGFLSCYHLFLPWYFGGHGDNFHDVTHPTEYEWRTPPQWAGDGREVIFAHGGSIYAARADGTALRLIHGEGGENDLHQAPQLSPDGSRMTYLKFRHDGSERGTYHWEVAVSAPDGAREQTITDGLGFSGSPSWSPDGKRIAVRSDYEVRIIASDGSGLSVIGGPRDTSQSGPDPSRLGKDLFMPLSDTPLTWSPDGRQLGLIGQYHKESVGPQISNYTIELDDSTVQMIWMGGSVPQWSPDGTRVAFSSLDQSDDGTGTEIIRLHTARPDGSDLTELFLLPEDAPWDTPVTWSPTGEEVLFGPFVASVDGSVLRLLPPPEIGYRPSTGRVIGPPPKEYSLTSWSPDGSRIAILANFASVLYTVARDGTDIRVLVEKDEQGNLVAAGGRPHSEGQVVQTIYPEN